MVEGKRKGKKKKKEKGFKSQINIVKDSYVYFIVLN